MNDRDNDMNKLLIINEIKRRKELGMKVILECVDEETFLDSLATNEPILSQDEMVVESVETYSDGSIEIILEGDLEFVANVIYESEIHLFRIKDDEGLPKDWNGRSATHVYLDESELISELMDKNYIFYRLVELAYQAWKDGFIERILLEDGFVEFEIKNKSQNNTIITYFRDDAPIDFYYDVIQELERLYYEEFVIENEEDMNLISDGDRATLTNGNEITIEVSDMGGIRRYGFYDMIDGNRQHVPLAPLTFTTLKGATIKRRLNYGN